jgi:hypothetical protein
MVQHVPHAILHTSSSGTAQTYTPPYNLTVVEETCCDIMLIVVTCLPVTSQLYGGVANVALCRGVLEMAKHPLQHSLDTTGWHEWMSTK